MKFIDIPTDDQKALLDSLQTQIGLKSAIIEKDWWVTAIYRWSLPVGILSLTSRDVFGHTC